MTERQYDDDEVDAIFARASEVEQDAPRRLQPSQGRTLAELQAIGQEAGLSPDAIAQAARSLDQLPQPSPARFLGLPLGVARTVSLKRRLTDTEWEQLVVQLRETFDARGVMRSEGSFRSWSNGNLQVLLEPDGEGHRIRFKTVNGQSRALMMLGLGVFGVASIVGLVGVLSGAQDVSNVVAELGGFVVIGAGAFGLGALRLPGWAKRRAEQMERLSSVVAQLPDPANR